MQGLSPDRRLLNILAEQALLALEPFGRTWVYPSVCFCEGDEAARARLIAPQGNGGYRRPGRYMRFGIAFHRSHVEEWGARPLIYADADIIAFLLESLASHERSQSAQNREEIGRLAMTRALLTRDWPGSEEGRDYFDQHGLDYDLLSPNEWSHEHEMRLLLADPSGWAPSRAYWTFDGESVAHLLLPAGHPEDLANFAQAVADHAPWAAHVDLHLLGTDGVPRETGQLSSFRSQ